MAILNADQQLSFTVIPKGVHVRYPKRQGVTGCCDRERI